MRAQEMSKAFVINGTAAPNANISFLKQSGINEDSNYL
jgi:hypothetical protein